MRPANAATTSRLDCCNDYASGPMAPTSGTNRTLGRAARHARDQRGEPQALAGIAAGEPPSRSRFRQVKKPHADAACPSNGNQKPQLREAGLAFPAITP
jgi:hypothetical protein